MRIDSGGVILVGAGKEFFFLLPSFVNGEVILVCSPSESVRNFAV